MILPYSYYFMIVAFLAGLLSILRVHSPQFLKLFTAFLLISFIVEVIAFRIQLHGKNTSMYNIWTVLEFSFYFYLLYEIVLHKIAKKVVLYTAFSYALVAFINIFMIQGIATFHTMTYSLGCLLIVAICIYYFLELFQQPRSMNLMRQPAFWICSGLLFFYCSTFPIFAFTNFIMKLPAVILQNLVNLVNLLNVFLYSSFTIAFLCRLKVRKSMS